MENLITEAEISIKKLSIPQLVSLIDARSETEYFENFENCLHHLNNRLRDKNFTISPRNSARVLFAMADSEVKLDLQKFPIAKLFEVASERESKMPAKTAVKLIYAASEFQDLIGRARFDEIVSLVFEEHLDLDKLPNDFKSSKILNAAAEKNQENELLKNWMSLQVSVDEREKKPALPEPLTLNQIFMKLNI